MGPSFNDLLLVLAAVIYGYTFVISMPGYHTATVTGQDLEPACQNECLVNIPPSSVHKFDSLSLDSTKVLFVHFSGYNSSLQPSHTTDILDPLNLVWVENTAAPFLSLDIGFNVYSFTTLSRIVKHMDVMVEVEPINCWRHLNHSCVTWNLARAFLGNVTRERGVLCYTINDSNTVNYRCCKVNKHTKKVECGISPVLSPNMRTIFIVTAIATAIAFMCFPALFDIVPDEEMSTTLSANSQLHNRLSQLVIRTVHALRRYSTDYYWVNVIRKLLIGLSLPALYHIDYGLQWYITTHHIPAMFNEAVQNLWLDMSRMCTSICPPSSSTFLIVNLIYIAAVLMFSLLPPTESLRDSTESLQDSTESLQDSTESPQDSTESPQDSTESPQDSTESPQDSDEHPLDSLQSFDSFNSWEQYTKIKEKISELRSQFENKTGTLYSRLVGLLGCVLLTLPFTVVTLVLFIAYAGHVSPLGKRMRPFYDDMTFYGRKLIHTSISLFLLFLIAFFILYALFSFTIIYILHRSLLLSARLIVYLWMGLAATKDHYFPRIAVISVFVYYCWNCLSSVTCRYQVLLKQTFEKCKEHQEKHPNGRKALEFDEEGVPRISSELFEKVIGQILPRSEVYIKMILKLTVIILFLCLTFESILVYGDTNLNQSTQALAILLTGLLPKIVEIFGEGDSYWQLYDTENACRVEKIVRDFLTQSDDTNPDDESRMSHDDQQLPPQRFAIVNVAFNNQPATTNTGDGRNQPILEEYTACRNADNGSTTSCDDQQSPPNPGDNSNQLEEYPVPESFQHQNSRIKQM